MLLFDTIFGSKSSLNINLTVNKFTIAAGKQIILTTTITPATSSVTITFYENNIIIGTAITNSSGVATLTRTISSVGTYSYNSVSDEYINYNKSYSNYLNVVVETLVNEAWVKFSTPDSTSNWQVPAGVTRISILAIGCGGVGRTHGGGGGALAFINNFSVTPGEILTVDIGSSNTNGFFGSCYVTSSTIGTVIHAWGGETIDGGSQSTYFGVTGVVGGKGGKGGRGHENYRGIGVAYTDIVGGGGGAAAGYLNADFYGTGYSAGINGPPTIYTGYFNTGGGGSQGSGGYCGTTTSGTRNTENISGINGAGITIAGDSDGVSYGWGAGAPAGPYADDNSLGTYPARFGGPGVVKILYGNNPNSVSWPTGYDPSVNPTVSFPANQISSQSFGWTITGGLPNDAYWITTTSPSHRTYGSINSPYGYLDSNGNASINAFTLSPDIGTYNFSIFFRNGNKVTKTITLTYDPITPTFRFNSVANDGDRFVAVGESGNIFLSTDKGVTWHARSSGVTAELKRVRYLNGVFVAVGLSGTLIYSSDGGNTWTRNTNVTSTYDLYGINYSSGATSPYYWICGTDRTGAYLAYFSSLTTTTFTRRLTSINSTDIVTDVNNKNSQIIAVTNGGQSWYNVTSGTSTFTKSTGTGTNYKSISGVLAFHIGSNANKAAYTFPPNLTTFFINTPTNATYLNGITAFTDTNTVVSVGYYEPPLGGTPTRRAVIFSWPFYTSGTTFSTPVYDSIVETALPTLGKDLYEIAGSSTNNYVAVGSAGCLIYATSYTGTWNNYEAAYTQ
jgi:hypothetical protein